MTRAACALILALACPAGAFELNWPVDCTPGETCFIQQYVDRDPGPGVTDFACGTLAYDGHEGTDIALPSLAALQAGVTVRAAAPGTVLGVRDGMPDILVSDPAAPPLEGRDCGNGVVIDHGQGWQTQYCHMARGSVAVRSGDSVAAGTPLGQVGLSGRTEFPHLHVTVRKDGQTVDPFDPDGTLACGETAPPLWSDPPAYRPGGLIAAGFDIAVPKYEAVKAGMPARAVLPAKAPALVIWGYYFGNRAGDELRLTITGPEGEVISETVPLDRTQAQAFRAVGKRLRGPSGWPVGDYTGEAVLIRAGAEIDRIVIAARIDG
ncbi:M23 family metallopeptidase [Aliigemmobacter aestuarii]|uniref:M23 family metallopeptidase n=1 Tax=Aliigemmobacter aestuarii TaxID=1445661 RepID=A0A4S3MR67_9RHOB|nr:M23 family metallopeptidase [Gemmobacter aestuarii]THD84968.1 M23 family metallopeptidase [Gemmobacter aestuarii]